MGVMPEGMSKGAILKKLDTRYAVPPTTKPQLQARLASLKPPALKSYPFGSFVTLALAGGVLNADEADHIRAHWFNETVTTAGGVTLTGQGWWKSIQPIEPIIREGLIAAIEVALRDPDAGADRPIPLPIVFLWMCHAGHSLGATPTPSADEAVEVDVSWSPYQVTLVIHTPDPPPDTGPGPTDPEPIYVVKRDSHTGNLVRVRPKYYP